MATLTLDKNWHINETQYKTSCTLLFTVGNDKDTPKKNWPIYVFDRLLSGLDNVHQLYRICVDKGMLSRDFIEIGEDKLYCKIIDYPYEYSPIFNNKLIEEQSCYLISTMSDSFKGNPNLKHFQEFIQEFLISIQDFRALFYLSEEYGDRHELYLLSSRYFRALKEYQKDLDDDKEKEVEQAKKEIISYFQDYRHLRKSYDIQEKIKQFIEKRKKMNEALKLSSHLVAEQARKEQEKKAKAKNEPIEINKDDYEFVKITPEEPKKVTRCLCLVLGSLKDPLVLMEDDSQALDDAIMNQFSDSDKVRNHFKEEIKNYLEKEQKYLKELRDRLNRPNYRGQIVILEKDEQGFFKREENGQYLRIAVLYSSILKQVKRFSLNADKMSQLIKQDTHCVLFSDYERKTLKRALLRKEQNIKNSFESTRKAWFKSIVESKNKYDYLRVLKHYLETGIIRPLHPEIKMEEESKEDNTENRVVEETTDDIQKEEFLTQGEYDKAFHSVDYEEWQKGLHERKRK